MMNALEVLNTLDLGSVCGGASPRRKPGFNAGLCFDNSWPWALFGGGLLGGVAAAATSPACGNGTQSPATMLRNRLFTPNKETPSENARFGPIFKK